MLRQQGRALRLRIGIRVYCHYETVQPCSQELQPVGQQLLPRISRMLPVCNAHPLSAVSNEEKHPRASAGTEKRASVMDSFESIVFSENKTQPSFPNPTRDEGRIP